MNNLTRRRPLERTVNLILLVVIVFIVAVSFFPFVWMILNSFKTNTEIFQSPLKLPAGWDFESFSRAWTLGKFGIGFKNSLIVTGSVVMLNLVFASMAAFATSHLRFRGKALFLAFSIGCQVVSGQILLVPLFKLLREMNLYNTLFGLILVLSAFSFPMSIYLFNGFFKAMPREVYESTKIDGCNNLIYYLKILLPLSTPIIASVAIFQAMFTWNEYLFALTFLSSPGLWTIPPLLRNFFSARNKQYAQIFAGLSIVVVPILMLYIFLQKYFITGLTLGGVKE
jgi:raffinose/stachyose/melibiose transport system permease protein